MKLSKVGRVDGGLPGARFGRLRVALETRLGQERFDCLDEPRIEVETREPPRFREEARRRPGEDGHET